MDILYYSNHCPHSQKVVQYISKNGFIDKINAICLDKRIVDPNTGQVFIQLENGKKIMLPPNVHSVPALLLVKQNYSTIYGKDILQYFAPSVKENTEYAEQNNGEPVGMPIQSTSSGVAILSEQYTLYDLTPEDLSSKSQSTKRPMYNYVSASNHQSFKIQTPPDTYRPDKVSISMETIEQQRNSEIPGPPNPYGI